ncbi:TRAP-type C4-dicarboxylate transport system, small permease component [Winogradskyella psychrotolerans RS-3]|uniref:TRAP-type C4-dicarboxylate transport system, small permease component n=1 Tax=Winogradskyella psychrotolerans RS-3 TaxID=641526 RepID=S7X8J7_9FLAO|nr:TRAP transporter small permease [Winogradskyella psychrotolerans]EPR72363.1 TRAP-type C4-dicarboxylate transport system, small permease component [Winogradskyella psychrotolerans RS-3]
MKTADILFTKVCKFIEIVLISIFGLLVVDVLLQVFSRYILNTSFTFTEELARFSLIWISILGAAYLSAKREHLSMDFLYQKMGVKSQKKTLIFIEICVFLFALFIMVIGGLNLVYTTLHLGQLSGTLRIPLGYIYAILPLSGMLMMCFSIYHFAKIRTNDITD